jgi:aspartyl-tRNA(Asn)/glutamyl-tRNA(Gln) amidotransferase subunit C
MAMAPHLTRDDVAAVARLARLELDDDELDAFTGQLASILEHAEDIEALDIDDVPATAHPYELVNVLRPDEVRPTVDRDEVLAQAPDAADGRFRVPAILGEPE